MEEGGAYDGLPVSMYSAPRPRRPAGNDRDDGGVGLEGAAGVRLVGQVLLHGARGRAWRRVGQVAQPGVPPRLQLAGVVVHGGLVVHPAVAQGQLLRILVVLVPEGVGAHQPARLGVAHVLHLVAVLLEADAPQVAQRAREVRHRPPPVLCDGG